MMQSTGQWENCGQNCILSSSKHRGELFGVLPSPNVLPWVLVGVRGRFENFWTSDFITSIYPRPQPPELKLIMENSRQFF